MTLWQSRLLSLVLVGLLVAFSIHVFYTFFVDSRLDMTSDDLYSLTDGSRDILQKMRDEGVKPVEITLYFSETAGKTLPKFVKDFISYDRYLKSLLREYERDSRGKIEVDFVDPLPDSDLAQRAADAGLDGKLINQEGDLFYFGMTFETQTGSRSAIDFLWPNEQENVEYEISKTLYNLLWPSKKRIGVLSSLEVFGSSQDPFMAQMMAAQGRQPTQEWISIQLLKESYDVSPIPSDTDEISPDDYDLVVVIHPRDLPKKTVWALDQWVQGGGNTLIFLDPYALDDRPPQNPQQPWAALQYKPSSNLDDLLHAWGIERVEDAFAADRDLAVRRNISRTGPAEALLIDLAIDAETREETMAVDQPILQGLNDLRFLLAGQLREVASAPIVNGDGDEGEDGEASSDGTSAKEGEGAASGNGIPEGVTVTPLLTTTASGSTLTVQPGFGDNTTLAYPDFNQPAKLRDRFVPGDKPVVLAYLLRGRLPSAWPQGIDYPSKEAERPPNLPPGIELPPPEDAEMIHKDPLPDAERQDAAVMVFADVDFISDNVAFVQTPFGIVQAANDNHKVLLNSADFLLGSQELMSVRAKSTLRRPFKLFDDIEAAAELETIDREREIRAEIETFQEELRAKQSEITQRNAALFQKKVQDEVDLLNERIEDANGELREIRKARRSRLEREENMVRFAVMGWMPLVVLAAGIYLAQGRRRGPRGPSASPQAEKGAGDTATGGQE